MEKEPFYEVHCDSCGQLFEVKNRPDPNKAYLCPDCAPTEEEIRWMELEAEEMLKRMRKQK